MLVLRNYYKSNFCFDHNFLHALTTFFLLSATSHHVLPDTFGQIQFRNPEDVEYDIDFSDDI